MTLTVQNLDELDSVAAQLLEAGRRHSVWSFYGEMGAGKTTLIKAVCRRLGVRKMVNSPTFGIVHEYVTPDGEPIFHFDCYRLRDESQALDIGIEEYLDSGALCLIEWPERISNLLPPDHWPIHLEVEGETGRIIKTD